MLKIDNEFTIEQIVYLKTDSDQLERMVYAFIVFQDSILYRLCCGEKTSDHYGFEINAHKKY